MVPVLYDALTKYSAGTARTARRIRAEKLFQEIQDAVKVGRAVYISLQSAISAKRNNV